MSNCNLAPSFILPGRSLGISPLLVTVFILFFASISQGQSTSAPPVVMVQNHSIEGKLLQPAGGGRLEEIVVTIVETGATTQVDSSGNFVFPAVRPGTYTLMAAGKDYAGLKFTHVTVAAGETRKLAVAEIPAALAGGLRTVNTIAGEDEGLQKLPSFFVSSTKARSFEGGGGNMDIPRSSNDVQAYTIINAEAIEQSNRLNLGDFLQDQVTQSTTGLQYNQSPATYDVSASGTSQVNLRGFGNLQTLMLVNGSRLTGVVFKGVESQPNVNQIPLAAIDHVEILPSSASGIYGSSAVGGVINIVLKKNFSGGQIQTSYQNTFVTDNPTRTMSLYDSIFIKKTHVTFVLSYSDGKGPIRQDRPFIKNNLYRVLANAPALYFSANSPYAAGAVPNIAVNPAAVNGYTNPTSSSLTFKDGTSLGSTLTYVPVGTTPSTASSILNAGLLANAGKQNFDEAASVFRGSQTPLLSVPQNKSIQVTINHKFNDKVEVYLDTSLNQQKTHNPYLPLINGTQRTNTFYVSVPGNSPVNPFQQNVFVSLPLPARDSKPFVTTSLSRVAKAGVQVHLPKGWEALAEYSFSYGTNSIKYGLMNFNSTTVYGAELPLLYKGLYNPFVDTVANDQNIAQYYGNWTFFNPTHLLDFNTRLSGPFITLPGGATSLTAGAEARINVQDINYEVGTFPSLPGDNGAPNISNTPANQYFGGEKQAVKSFYVEMGIPVVSAKNHVPLVQGLELQVAGRIEDFSVITNPDQVNYYPNYPVESTRVTHTTKPGRNWFKYSSVNPTLGIKYTPINWLVLRGSYAAGYVPPTYTQFGSAISGASVANTAATFDPKTGLTYLVPQLQGNKENPDLKPQTSKNWGWGAIFQPESGPLKDLRLSLDFYKLQESNTIFRPSYAQALASPSLAYLVPRGADGLVTSYTLQFLNAQHQNSRGYDVSIDYRLKIATVGTFGLHAGGTVINHLMLPFTMDGPLLEYAGFANSGGAIKTKANSSLTWLVGKNWTLGWNTRYWGSYKQQGSPSDPQYNGLTTYTPVTTQLLPQGGIAATNGISIPSQMYHNSFVTYVFGHSPKLRYLAGTTIQVGINNVFNTAPPFDAHSSLAPFYYSPYGSVLLRTYLVKIKRDF